MIWIAELCVAGWNGRLLWQINTDFWGRKGKAGNVKISHCNVGRVWSLR
jgi:hypothetical protein